MKIQVEQRNKNARPEERHGNGGKKKLKISVRCYNRHSIVHDSALRPQNWVNEWEQSRRAQSQTMEVCITYRYTASLRQQNYEPSVSRNEKLKINLYEHINRLLQG